MLAHGIWLNDHELDILATRGVSIAVNTNSNLKLASGFAPLRRYMAHGVNFCLGTDGVASNNRLDMLSEISNTARLHKALNEDASFMPAERILQATINGGAKAIGMQARLGSLETGKLADIICISTDDIGVLPMFDPYSHLAYSITSEQIRHVVINGRIVMQNRQLQTVDEAPIRLQAQHYRKKLAAQLREE